MSAKMNKIFTEAPPPLNEKETALFQQVKTVRTTSRDARFPSANQAGHCWNRYNEWILCLNNTKDKDSCTPLRYYATNICPGIWVEAWDEQREEGTFAGLKEEK
mmetsp:Transcript_17661/g.40994  ORF Transcript_17661/g.40994 Transcript_17661/m.40994 type:complete len:104 (-) Transcript_17661:161-472(-)